MIVFCPLFFTEGEAVSVIGSLVVRLVFLSFDPAKDLPEIEAEDGAECQAEKKKEHLVILFAAFAVFLQKRGLESFGFAFYASLLSSRILLNVFRIEAVKTTATAKTATSRRRVGRGLATMKRQIENTPAA